LPLARLRGRGESTEVRAADLRFTPDEAAAFLTQEMGLNLTAGEVAALETRTEGWIAGLHLAALSMQGRADLPGFIQAFAGDDRYIVDYLIEEVLQRQSERVRSFLLQTSMLDRLSGPLCDAVTGRDDGKGMLEALERDNLFVVPLDDKRHWYRYHHLFADVLRAHLPEELPDHLPQLHQRAAAWFEARGMAAEAIEHAHSAGDHETVARLMVANAEEFERIGRFASIARWSASLPQEMVRRRPRLALIYASAALAVESNLAAARELTAWAEEAIDAIETGGGVGALDDVDGTVVGADGLDALKGEVLTLKLAHSARKLPAEEVAAMARQALALLPPEKHQQRGMVRLIDAGFQMERSDLRSARPVLEEGLDEARRSRHPMFLACMLGCLGEVDVDMGRLDDGQRLFEEAIAVGQSASAEAGWTLCGPHAWLAEVRLERGDLAGALDHVAKVREFAEASPMRSYVLYGRAAAAQVLLAAGDVNAARAQIEEAQRFAQGIKKFRYASFLSSAQLKFFCRLGDLDAAAEVARERGLSPDVPIDHANAEELTSYARYLLARGVCDAAVRVLAKVLPIARDGGRVRHEINALVLQALAYERLGERVRALTSLGRATMLGELGRFTRAFTGEGPVVTRLVAALVDAARRGRGPVESGSPSYLAYLMGAAGSRPEPVSARPAPAELAEPLTGREVEILRLIAVGMRNQEIADQLFISLPTVKRHIANAYGKLGVDHRTEAIAQANALNLL
jgi:LuxR family maltose regulon positive regulatory protein